MKPQLTWFKTYIASAQKFRAIAQKAGAVGIIANHTNFDGSKRKFTISPSMTCSSSSARSRPHNGQARTSTSLGFTQASRHAGPRCRDRSLVAWGTVNLRYWGSSNEIVSTCIAFSFAPDGTRKGIAQENSGTFPTSTNETAVLYALPEASISVGRLIGSGL